MRKIVLNVKRDNCKTPLPEAISRFILRKNLFIESNYKSIGESLNKEHLLHSNLLSNHIEVRFIIVRLSRVRRSENIYVPKENKPREVINK